MSDIGHHSGGFAVSVHQEGSLQHVSLRGAADLEHVGELEQQLGVLGRSDTPKIIFDLTDLTFINSAGLGAFIAVHRRCREHGGEMCLVHPRDAVAQVLRVTNLDRLVRIYPDLDAAQKALTGGDV